MKRVMLYFGSFNPVHNGHIALAEYVIEAGLCDELVLVVSPQSPFKSRSELAPDLARFEMAEMACAASKYPDQIKPSVVEFLLPKPSYTIDTLRHLTENYGTQMTFSVLMGGDQIARLDDWKDYHELLANYPIYVYPRQGAVIDRFADRITLLGDAPLQDFSSTQVRRMLGEGDDAGRMLAPEVADYIRREKLWSPEARMEALDLRIEAEAENATLYIERGRLHYRRNNWGAALNDFNRALRIDDQNAEARQYAQMIQEILEFRYKDIYNP